MGPDQVLVLRAGLPPVRARKIRYYRSPAFKRRLLPPPAVPPRPNRPCVRDPASGRQVSRPAEQAGAAGKDDKAAFLASYIAQDQPHPRSS